MRTESKLMSSCRSLTLCLAVMALGACDQPVDEGKTDSGKADGATADRGRTEGVSGKTVQVKYQGKTRVVDLSKPTPVDFKGAKHARLSDVVQLAALGKTLDSLTADFMSSDGFKPGSKAPCAKLIPVPGNQLVKGYIDPATRNLKWEDSLKWPGCISVRDLSEIWISDK